jgi:lysophospholipase L1-like esterase
VVRRHALGPTSRIGCMGKAAARRLAAAAAFGGGGLSLAGASAYGLLRAEALLARRAIGNADGEPPRPTGWYGHGRPGPAIKVVLLGDSSAAGYGVEQVRQTPGAHLASGLAEAAERRVYLRSVAVVGAQSRDLASQVDLGLTLEPDVAVILIGVNDVTHSRPASESARLLSDAVRRLRAAEVEVVVGTCPDLGTVRPIPHPLRWIARRLSRQLAAAQTVGVVERGGRTVSLGTLLGPEFALRPKDMFSPDGFHPSAHGYARAAAAMLPALAGVLNLVPEEPPTPVGVLPVAEAAAAAVDASGTEVTGTEVSGAERGPWGRWALLLRPRRRALPQVELAEDTVSDVPPDAPLADNEATR